jgi:integrase
MYKAARRLATLTSEWTGPDSFLKGMTSMPDGIKVSVNAWGAGRSLVLSWVDQVTGKRKTKSAKTKDWRTAERLAGELEKELEAGTVSPSRITWSEFVNRYTDEKLSTLAPVTRETALASLRHVKRVLEIEFLAKLTAEAISRFAAAVGKEGMKATTLAHHLRHVKAATRWAAKLGLMTKPPAIEMPKRARGTQARSRAVTTEEYDRMAEAVVKVRKHDAAQWKHYIEGLWLSGLRRSEALALTWDQDGVFCVHLGEKRPVFIIRAQKSGKAETCPMSPDFGAWLLAVPDAERSGLVFPLIDKRTNQPISPHRVGQIVERIGKAANVKVGTRIGWVTEQTKDKITGEARKERKRGEVPVFAGCHSLRRGFGSKWARRASPSVLKRLMRHSSIATTEGYYVHMEAADVSEELWTQYGPDPTIAGNSLQQTCNTPPVESIAR